MYHINDDGDVKRCSAKSPERCRFYKGEEDTRHYPNEAAALKAAEEISRQETGADVLHSTAKNDYNYADIAPKERAEKLSEDLEKAIDDIVASGDLKRYFDAMARNGARKWSFSNVLLAGMQLKSWKERNGIKTGNILEEINNLHAMGAKQWKKEGRYVSSGKGSALYILAPLVKKSPLVDQNGNPVLGEDGKPKTRDHVYGYRSVAVFDASQTKGEPIPENPIKVQPITKEIDQKYVDDMKSAVEKEGFSYSEREIATDPEKLEGTLGFTRPDTHEVVVDSRLSKAQKAAVLSHELSHIKMGHVSKENLGEYSKHRGEMETEAEGLSYMLMRRAGLDAKAGASFSPGYIAGWSKGDKSTVKRALNKITSRFGKITEELGW